MPRFRGKNLRDYKAALRTFFFAHAGRWAFVQGHMTSTAAFYLPIAKEYGDVRMAHILKKADFTQGDPASFASFLEGKSGVAVTKARA